MQAGEPDRILPSAVPSAKKNKLSQPSSLVDTAASAATTATATEPKVRWCEEDKTLSHTDRGAEAGGACTTAGHRERKHGGRHPYSVRPMGDYLAHGTAEVRRRKGWAGSCDREGKKCAQKKIFSWIQLPLFPPALSSGSSSRSFLPLCPPCLNRRCGG